MRLTDDAALISRVLVSDDRNAFGELVRHHQSVVRGVLRRLCAGDATKADDLSQVTFLRAYERLREYRGDAAFSSWLVRIACNAFLSDVRRKTESATAASDLVQPSPALRGPLTLLRHDLERALGTLPVEERMALVLTYARDLSHEEAAETLGCPLGTLKARVSRAKDRLRPLLESWEGAEAT
jgi:RNA polymerase sigma factor (sigma-70 family)